MAENWQANWSYSNPTSGASSDVEGSAYNVDMTSGIQSSSWNSVGVDSNIPQGGNWQGGWNPSDQPQTAASTAYSMSPSQFVPTQDEFQFVSATESPNKGSVVIFNAVFRRFNLLFSCLHLKVVTMSHKIQHIFSRTASKMVSGCA